MHHALSTDWHIAIWAWYLGLGKGETTVQVYVWGFRLSIPSGFGTGFGFCWGNGTEPGWNIGGTLYLCHFCILFKSRLAIVFHI